jgi:hypothetical protein
VIGIAAPRYTGGDQYDLDSNHLSATEENVGGGMETTFDSATGITTTYTYKPNTNYVQSVESAKSVDGSLVSSYSYTYRADGLKTGAVEYSLNADGSSDTVTLSWNYDALDR